MQSLDFHFINYTNQNLHHPLLHSLFQQKKRYNSSCAWFIYFDFTTTIQDVVKKFYNAPLNFNDDFIVALNNKKYGQVILWELYKIGSIMPIQHIQLGKWTTFEGLKFTNSNKR